MPNSQMCSVQGRRKQSCCSVRPPCLQSQPLSQTRAMWWSGHEWHQKGAEDNGGVQTAHHTMRHSTRQLSRLFKKKSWKKREKGRENCSGLKGTKEAITKCTVNTDWLLEQNAQLSDTVLSELSKFKHKLYTKYYWINANILKSDNVLAVMEETILKLRDICWDFQEWRDMVSAAHFQMV